MAFGSSPNTASAARAGAASAQRNMRSPMRTRMASFQHTSGVASISSRQSSRCSKMAAASEVQAMPGRRTPAAAADAAGSGRGEASVRCLRRASSSASSRGASSAPHRERCTMHAGGHGELARPLPAAASTAPPASPRPEWSPARRARGALGAMLRGSGPRCSTRSALEGLEGTTLRLVLGGLPPSARVAAMALGPSSSALCARGRPITASQLRCPLIPPLAVSADAPPACAM
mmetsp:Transcript_2457/g.7009  ORF Transcript_2457/g.7009 Transcript_2457/m.7009 type:complete len:233 (-) Transcript_2457:644-1342(-)